MRKPAQHLQIMGELEVPKQVS